MKKDYHKTYQRIGILLLTLVILASSFINPIPVYAATQDRVIVAQGADSGGWHGYVGGAADYTNLNSDDDGLTYWEHISTTYAYTSFDMQDYTGGDAISNVRITFRSQMAASATTTPYVLIGGTRYYGTTQGFCGWTTFTENTFGGVTDKNPATGLDWTTASLNAAEFGIRSWGGSTYAQTSYFLLTVTYTSLPPTVTTNAATDIGYVAPNHIATLNGSITDTGGENADYYGWAYGTTANATSPLITEAPHNGTYGASWISGAGSYGINDYDHDLVGLAAGTTYYCRFAAHNSLGWSWGSALTFVTLCDPILSLRLPLILGQLQLG